MQAYMLQMYSGVPFAEASRVAVTIVVRVNVAQTAEYYRQ